MKSKKIDSLYRCILLLFLILILGMLIFYKNRSAYDASVFSEKYVPVEEIKGELAFSIYTPEEWEEFFYDYRKEYLTEEMLNALLKQLGVAEYIEGVEQPTKNAVSREKWDEIYIQIIDYLDVERKVEKETVLVLEWLESENENVLFTNKGDIYTKLPVSLFCPWNAYDIYRMDGECVGISRVSPEESTIANAYLKDRDGDKIGFLYDGGEYEIEIKGLETEIAEGVCDFVLKNGTLETIGRKQDSIQGQLLSYDSDYIEIEGYGKIRHSRNMPVYQTVGEVSEKSVSDVVLGNMEAEYIIGAEEVCAILIKNTAEIARVRVLLLAPDGTNFRENVWLKCEENAVLSNGSETETVPAGTVICAGDYLQNGETTLMLKPQTETARIYLCDENGGETSNGYSGTMEVRLYPEGFTVVNDVSMEAYLYAVVPSEMPSGYEPEALKAQAVCARSYAYVQVLRADLAEYGAHINDSTSYQVYNKQPETEASVAAVNATAGMVMTYQENVIEAYYFSTSMGYTGTAEVWNTEETASYGYLKSVCLNQEPYPEALSEETAFKNYLHTETEGCDSDIKFYRWQGEADYRDRTDTIKEILKGCRQTAEKNITYYAGDGKTVVDNCGDFGKLENISVQERSSAGAILVLRLTFEGGIAEVRNEYNIRRILGCGLQKITFMDGSESDAMTILPSAYCTVEQQADGSCLLDGGGYGHGIGMSQNGANGLAKEGYSYEEILHYFYHEITIEKINIEI